jgi:histidinol-phosphate/aromatic aminotransferase/cobyric acid decarboxylase-like protein
MFVFLLSGQRLLAEGAMVRPTEPMRAPGCVRIKIGTREANAAFVEVIRKI